MLKYICIALVVACVFANDSEDKLERKKRALGVSMSTFKTQNLNCHNKYRSIHQVGPLTYSSTLNNYAQNYANKLANANGGLKHSGGPYGENLYQSSGSVNGNSACDNWYSENSQYDYSKDKPNNFADVGHFTQLVWKNSKQMGVGVATSRSGKTYVVASYSPPGNFNNAYRANVLPPRSG